jgi:transcription-repair coupling factor (superfamily II helicase)
LARLRTEAIRVGLTEIVKLRNEIRIGPVDLSDSQEIRLRRLAPKSVLRAGEGSVFLPAPPDAKVVEHLIAFIEAMWA